MAPSVLGPIITNLYIQWRRDGGTRGSPHEIEKIVVEIWCYLPEVYTFGAKAEIIEKFRENL